MTEAVKIVTLINIMLVIVLMLSGSIGGWLGESIYYLAVIISMLFCNAASDKLKYTRDVANGLVEDYKLYFEFDRKRLGKLLPLVAPIVSIVFLTSLISALILSLVGIKSTPVENQGLVTMLLVHAVLPAILEEVMFRYIPLRLLEPYSKRWCVIYSAICFALIHCNFAQMPYAFVAGALFMLVDISLDSIWPSLILHFINNATSVIWIKYCSDTTATIVFISILSIFTLVSLMFIYRKRNDYKVILKDSFDKGEAMPFIYAPFALAAICCYVAAASI